MKCVIGSQLVCSRTPEGPIAPHIGSFAEFLSTQGYALESIRRQVLLAAAFSLWLKQKRIELDRVAANHSQRYLRYRAQQKDRRSNAMSLPSEPRQAWADQRAEGLFLETDVALGAPEEAETIQRGG
jgi:hypothetical protein